MATTDHTRPLLEHELTYSDMETPKGLRNSRGENNCFLNSAVQVLWHVDAFRRRFRKIDDHTCTDIIYGEHLGRCIFCALKVVFTQFQYSDERCVPPDAIRNAMALTYDAEDRFQLGLMEDAAECFERILTRIHYHVNPDAKEEECTLAECIPHRQFAMNVTEQRVCNSCAAVSAPVTSVQMVCYVSGSALVDAFENKRHLPFAGSDIHGKPPNDFSLLLKCVLSDMGAGECLSQHGHTARMKRSLKSSPDVVTIGLIWDSARPDETLVTSAMQSVDCSLHISCLFDEVPQETVCRRALNLVAVLYYYSAHYSVFLYHAKRRMWVCVDDSYVQEVGPNWEQVIEKISRGRYLPLLLVYADHDDVPPAPSHQPLTRISVKGLEPSNTGRGPPSSFSTNGRGASRADGSTGSVTHDGAGSFRTHSCVDEFEKSRQPSYLAAVVGGAEASQGKGGNCISAPGNCITRDASQELLYSLSHNGHVIDRNISQWNKHSGSVKNQTQMTGVRYETSVNAAATKLPSQSFGDLAQWLQNGEDDAVGNYIDRRVVENVLKCRQLHKQFPEKKSSSQLASNRLNYVTDIGRVSGGLKSGNRDAGQQPRIADDLYQEFSGKLETEVDGDSGFSGDRNSASSTSSGLSVESSLTSLGSVTDFCSGSQSNSGSTISVLSADQSTVQPAEPVSHIPVPVQSRTSSLSNISSSSILQVAPDVQSSTLVSEQLCGLTSQRNTVKPSCHPPEISSCRNHERLPSATNCDDRCKQLLMDSETLADTSAEYERCGNISRAITACQQAIDTLHRAEVTSGLSHDMLLHIRMKRNVFVLNARRLQRLASSDAHENTQTSLPPDRICAQADNPREPIYLSKEEVGEILVRETERRRLRASAEVLHLPQLKPAVTLKTTITDHTCLKHEDVVHQQLKTSSVRDVNRLDNANIPDAGDEKVKRQTLNCQLIIPTRGQQDGETKMTEVLESVSGDGNLPGVTGIGINTATDIPTITDPCMPKIREIVDGVQNGSKVGCHTGAGPTNADSSAVRPGDDRRVLDATVTSAAGPAGKKKKTVTFSDNVELVASAGDVADPVDYMSYAASIGRHANSNSSAASMVDSLPTTKNRLEMPSNCCENSNVVISNDSSDKIDVRDCVTPSNKVRCSLCRQKWVELTDTYCSDCSFYLSKLQMAK